jgi:HPt (histidine-containing phosphotransfer) domain-containing protein
VFIEACSEDVLALRKYLVNNNKDQAYELLHRLAGRVGLAGAKELSQTLRVLERKVASDPAWDTAEIAEACTAIERLLESIAAAA